MPEKNNMWQPSSSIGAIPKSSSSSTSSTSSSSSNKSNFRFLRRRRRIIILLSLIISSIFALQYFSNSIFHSKSSSSSSSSSTLSSVNDNSKEKDNSVFGALFDLDVVNKYINQITEQSKKEELKSELKESELLVKVNQVEEELLNDSDELRKLYLTHKHNGIVNLGSTGNMADPSLNILKLKDKQSTLNDLEDLNKIKIDNNEKDITDDEINNNNKDRSIPLSNSNMPDEETFSKIKTDEFIKGDIAFQNFFSHILELIARNHLSFPLKRRMVLENGKPVIDNVLFYEITEDILSEKDLYSFFDFPQNFLDDLKVKHENIITGIPDILPQFYNGNGYVVVGGGIYSWYTLLGIETLRKVGSTLPVEVFLPEKSDYDYHFCEKILPQLNAKCIEMNRIFGSEALKNFQVEGYQYKAFALLASSFENAFLLDSDTFPVTNPDVIFDSKLYNEYKMITWPDFWRRTTSPHFYEIRGTEIGMIPIRHLNDYFVNPKYLQKSDGDITNSVTYHDRSGTIPDWTTESGEMLINKKEHFKTLILALYYNHDGPYGYYPLLSQGGAGEGDKETFVAAANFFNKKYYQVYKKPERYFGWWSKYQIWEHSTIVQYNPLSDYELLQNVQNKIRQDMEIDGDNFVYDYDKYYTSAFTPDSSVPMFYHVHDPKMNPYKIMDEKLTENLEGKKIRNMAEDFPRNNFDLERFIWNVINHYICELKLDFKVFEGNDREKLCNEFMIGQLSFLERSSEKITESYSNDNFAEQIRGGRDW
ncbi:hypothetical protein C6P40_004542 [Pichia californica]|uniref:Alpha-1,2-mannosyltransferase n=1 Tax=Pichia californica TaxID=460514 RepID=A0A9P6WMJ2_9ASCO|nr:hypothetical protein C6P42_004999 [[Candida] californica]KAG0689740.1 hypothetical protein C6P40_004542 [[Candida] californica]